MYSKLIRSISFKVAKRTPQQQVLYADQKGNICEIHTQWMEHKKVATFNKTDGPVNDRPKVLPARHKNRQKLKMDPMISNGVTGSSALEAYSSVSSANPMPDGQQTKKKAVAGTDDPVIIWTDGCTLNNGKADARVGVGVYFGQGDPRNVSERLQGNIQSNNRAELMAVLRALEVCGHYNNSIEIRLDSMHTIDVVNRLASEWVKSNWKRKNGQLVANRDIIEPLMVKIQTRSKPVTWTHVKAHAGIHGNEMADRLANAGARMPCVPK